MWACMDGKLEIVRALLENGSNANATTNVRPNDDDDDDDDIYNNSYMMIMIVINDQGR